jgi:hypothetical protein
LQGHTGEVRCPTNKADAIAVEGPLISFGQPSGSRSTPIPEVSANRVTRRDDVSLTPFACRPDDIDAAYNPRRLLINEIPITGRQQATDFTEVVLPPAESVDIINLDVERQVRRQPAYAKPVQVTDTAGIYRQDSLHLYQV